MRALDVKVYFCSILFFCASGSFCTHSPGAVTLGGKVTGLNGTMVFEDAGVQQMTVYSDGDFTFTGSRLQGQSYEVVLLGQPSGQFCTVTRGKGVFGNDNVKDVLIACEPLSIGAWNIQNFGTSKASISSVMDLLSKVIIRYDILFVEEIATVGGGVGNCSANAIVEVCNLLNRINSTDRAGAGAYAVLTSPTSGVGGNAEKYAVFYRANKVSVLSSFLADAASPAITPAITFTRPPFIVRFKAGDLDFYAINIHTTPDNVLTRQEINQLPYIANYLESAATQTDKDVVILGDFNSGSTFFTTPGDWTAYFANFNTSGYANQITDSQDTTGLNSNTFSYDRITLSPTLAAKVVASSAGPYYFDGHGADAETTCSSGETAYMNAIITAGCSGGILFGHATHACTCKGASAEVSDHYPVSVKLNP